MILTKNEVLAINLLSNEDAGIYIKKIIINKKDHKQKRKTSKYKGVHWNEKNRKWKVEISINGIRQYLGLFDNEIEASKAYRKALKENNNG